MCLGMNYCGVCESRGNDLDIRQYIAGARHERPEIADYALQKAVAGRRIAVFWSLVLHDPEAASQYPEFQKLHRDDSGRVVMPSWLSFRLAKLYDEMTHPMDMRFARFIQQQPAFEIPKTKNPRKRRRRALALEAHKAGLMVKWLSRQYRENGEELMADQRLVA